MFKLLDSAKIGIIVFLVLALVGGIYYKFCFKKNNV